MSERPAELTWKIIVIGNDKYFVRPVGRAVVEVTHEGAGQLLAVSPRHARAFGRALLAVADFAEFGTDRHGIGDQVDVRVLVGVDERGGAMACFSESGMDGVDIIDDTLYGMRDEGDDAPNIRYSQAIIRALKPEAPAVVPARVGPVPEEE